MGCHRGSPWSQPRTGCRPLGLWSSAEPRAAPVRPRAMPCRGREEQLGASSSCVGWSPSARITSRVCREPKSSVCGCRDVPGGAPWLARGWGHPFCTAPGPGKSPAASASGTWGRAGASALFPSTLPPGSLGAKGVAGRARLGSLLIGLVAAGESPVHVRRGCCRAGREPHHAPSSGSGQRLVPRRGTEPLPWAKPGGCRAGTRALSR